MNISDRKFFIREYFRHASALKEKSRSNRIDSEERLRVFHEKDRLMHKQRVADEIREEVKKQNLIAHDKEVEHKMLIKKSLHLNII